MKVFKLADDGTQKVGDLLASESPLDTINFDGNLDATITDVQLLADAVDELVLSSLPTPTANKLLRANGTEWVTSVNTELTESTNGGKLEVKNLTYPTKKYFNVFVSNTDAGFVFSNDTPSEPEGNKTISGYISSTSTSFILRSKNSEIMQFVTYPNNYMQIGMNGNGAVSTQFLSIKTTNTYTATEKIFGFGNTFSIYQNGKIVSNYLSGSGNQLIEVTPDGTIQRYTGTLPSLPTGIESQTLRYNASNQLESTVRLIVNPNQDIRINSTFSGSVYDTHLSILETNDSESFNEMVFAISQHGNIWNWALNNHNGEILYSNQGTISGSGKSINDVRKHIEFTSEPIVAPSSAYGFSNTAIGLDGINLIDKLKNVKSYIIQDGTTALDNSLVQGEIIEANQVSVITNSNLFAGDVIKIYIEYID